jgi:hypothetical protein
LNARIDELKWAVIAQELKWEEQEEQRRIKEQIREEEKARREFEKAIKEAQKEEEKRQKTQKRGRKEKEKRSQRGRKGSQKSSQTNRRRQSGCIACVDQKSVQKRKRLQPHVRLSVRHDLVWAYPGRTRPTGRSGNPVPRPA